MRGTPLAAVLLLLAAGCGPESTTATITAVGPLDPDDEAASMTAANRSRADARV